MFSEIELNGGEGYVPYASLDPLNDPKSFTFRIKVHCTVSVLFLTFAVCYHLPPAAVLISWHIFTCKHVLARFSRNAKTLLYFISQSPNLG